MTDLDFSARLKNCILTSGKTQVEIATELDISKHTIQKYLNGRIPDAKILYKIASYFGKTMEWFLTGFDSTSVQQNGNNKVEAIFDPDLKMIIDVMTNLLHNSDPNLRGWAIVHFKEAFEKYWVMEEEKKEHA